MARTLDWKGNSFMTAEHEKDAIGERELLYTRSYDAHVGMDDEVGSTVVTLSYEDKDEPARSITVCIAPELGSNMFRFRVGEYDILHCDLDLLKRLAFTGNFVLWPMPNRMRDKMYTYQGQSYSLKGVKRPYEDAFLVHGLVLDQSWRYETPLVGQDFVSVTTYIDITPESPFYAGYPFESRLSLTYVLRKNGISIHYSVHNRGSKDLPFGFALHPYFSTLSGKDTTLITIPANSVMEADATLLPTGRILPLDGIMYSMFDLRQPVPISHLKLDHVYTNVHKNAHAVIEYKEQAMRILISASNEFTHTVVFTPPPEINGPFFCIEHQTCSTDALNLHARGLREMAHLLEAHPGESCTGFIEYEVVL